MKQKLLREFAASICEFVLGIAVEPTPESKELASKHLYSQNWQVPFCTLEVERLSGFLNYHRDHDSHIVIERTARL